MIVMPMSYLSFNVMLAPLNVIPAQAGISWGTYNPIRHTTPPARKAAPDQLCTPEGNFMLHLTYSLSTDSGSSPE